MSPVRRWVLWCCVIAMLLGLARVGRAQTNVCGAISVDTTWDLAGSPYIITCDVVVLPGATLTIDDGVSIRFDPGVRLRAQGGRIDANGVTGNPVLFFSTDPTNRGYGVDIVPSSVTSTFDFCRFKELTYGIFLNCCGGITPVIVNDSAFDANTVAIGGYTGQMAQIYQSTFQSNGVVADAADKTFDGCTMTGNVTNFQSVERTIIRNSTITGGAFGVQGAGNSFQVEIYDTTITGTQVGVYAPSVMQRCVITNNGVGLRLLGQPASVQCNDILGNTVWNLELIGGSSLTVANNWWGSTNAPSIDARILDGLDQIGLGLALYTPFLNGPFASGPCNCVQPTVSALPPSISVYGGQTVAMSVSATGTAPLTYQWFRNGLPVANGGRFSGANTTTLTISPVARNGDEPAWTDSGSYHCVATNLCGSVASSPAFLSVTNCAADFNNSGMLDFNDIFDFLNAWFAGCP